MAAHADVRVAIPSALTPRIQEGHILSGHILYELVEAELFPHVKSGESPSPNRLC